VRPRDAPEQCLWLGKGQYRDGCRDAATNSGSDSYTTDNSDSVRSHDANAYAKRACVAYTYSYGYGDSDSSAESISYTERLHSSNAFTYGDSYNSTQSNAKASTDSASSAVM